MHINLADFESSTVEQLRRRRSEKWRRHPADVLPLGVAEMDFPLAPCIRERLAQAVAADDTGYHDPEDDSLVRAFVDWAARSMRWEVDPRGVLPVTDAMVGVAELLRRLTAPGDGVIITPPVYPPFFSTVREIGRTVVEVPLLAAGGAWALDVQAIDRALADGARSVLLCNPHNPTGTVLTTPDLLAVAESLARHGAWAVVDEIHAPLVLPGHTHQPFVALGGHAAARAATVTSASKAWNLAGLKCAVVVTAPGEVREAMTDLPEDAQYRVGHLGAIAAEAAWRHGDPWRQALLTVLDSRRQLLERLLQEHAPVISFDQPQGTYLAWLDCRRLVQDEDPAAYFLREAGVALQPGPNFGTQGQGYARLNFATTTAGLTEAVRRLGRAVSASSSPS